MAGVRRIWVSSTMVNPTTPTGLITGFTDTEWYLLDVFQNQASYIGNANIGAGGLQYKSTVSYNIKKLTDNVLKLTNDLAMSYGFSVVIQIGDEGIFPSANSWSVEYTGTNREQRINFVTNDNNRPRFLTPHFFDVFSGIFDSNVLTIDQSAVTIGGQQITIG